MKLSDILKPKAVKAIGRSISKKRLLQEVGEIAASAYGMDARETVDALQERENLGPTGVGHGVALPHARIGGLESITGVLLRLEIPVDFDSVDRQPVDLIFALFAPRNAGIDHLKALALVSRTLRDSDTRAKLRANDDASTLHAILTEARTDRAA